MKTRLLSSFAAMSAVLLVSSTSLANESQVIDGITTIEPQYEAGDSLDFAFSTDGKSVAVTGQVDGGAVNTTATIGVETQSEGKCQCYLYFMSFGHVYSLTFTIPSSGVVSSGDFTLDGAWNTYFGMINAW